MANFDKKTMRQFLFLIPAIALGLHACSNGEAKNSSEDQSKSGQTQERGENRTLDEQFKKYWYNNEAEISSYALKQARYGELHEGKAVTVFVSEPFSPQTFTKADNKTEKDLSVLKLNFTKKFNTGIYPYSMMNSTFVPIQYREPSLKISTSIQEWCGHVYMEMRRQDRYNMEVNSYFQGENAENIRLEKQALEDDIWSTIRLNPKELPTGKVAMVPSFFYQRLMHVKPKAYQAKAGIQNAGGDTVTYSLHYPKLNRSLKIHYQKAFPHQIYGWSETYESGFGKGAKMLTTKATLLKSIKSTYWQRNKKADAHLRKKLMLE